VLKIMKLRRKCACANSAIAAEIENDGELCSFRSKKRRKSSKKKSTVMRKILPKNSIHKHCLTSQTLTSFTLGCEIPVKKFGCQVYVVKVEAIISESAGVGSMYYETDGEVYHPDEPECFTADSKPDGFWKGQLSFEESEVITIPDKFVTKITHGSGCGICGKVLAYDSIPAEHPSICMTTYLGQCDDASYGEILVTDMQLITSFRSKLTRGAVGWRHFGAFTTISAAFSKLPELKDDVRAKYAVAKLKEKSDLKFCTELIDENWDNAKPSAHHPLDKVDWTHPITAKLHYGKGFYDHDDQGERIPSGSVFVPYLDFRVFLKTD